MGGTKAEAKHAAIDMAHGFAKLIATAHAAVFKCPREECPKMIGPQVANEKITELLTVKLQNNLYRFSGEAQLRHCNFLPVRPLTRCFDPRLR
jgi:hypothetical protein